MKNTLFYKRIMKNQRAPHPFLQNDDILMEYQPTILYKE